MKMYFYRGKEPNFGDELNPWLMPKIFPDLFDSDEATMFLGIGSILFDHHPKHATKVVFGSGFGGYTPPPSIDEQWMIYCVRGPHTAKALGLGSEFVAGDAAILINKFRRSEIEPHIPVSFIPHFQSLDRGSWRTVCEMSGVHFIDPRSSVDQILSEIQASRVIVAEAMHGAIVADALRVPWIAMRPFDKLHHFKWYDWADALNIRLSFEGVSPSSLQEAYVYRFNRRGHWLENAGGALRFGRNIVDRAFIAAAGRSLRKAIRVEPNLSSDQALGRVVDKLEFQALRIRRDFCR